MATLNSNLENLKYLLGDPNRMNVAKNSQVLGYYTVLFVLINFFPLLRKFKWVFRDIYL